MAVICIWLDYGEYGDVLTMCQRVSMTWVGQVDSGHTPFWHFLDNGVYVILFAHDSLSFALYSTVAPTYI